MWELLDVIAAKFSRWSKYYAMLCDEMLTFKENNMEQMQPTVPNV